MKTCPDCQRELSVSDFYTRGKSIVSYCKPCMAIRNLRQRERSKLRTHSAWRQDDPLNLAASAWIRTS